MHSHIIVICATSSALVALHHEKLNPAQPQRYVCSSHLDLYCCCVHKTCECQTTLEIHRCVDVTLIQSRLMERNRLSPVFLSFAWDALGMQRRAEHGLRSLRMRRNWMGSERSVKLLRMPSLSIKRLKDAHPFRSKCQHQEISNWCPDEQMAHICQRTMEAQGYQPTNKRRAAGLVVE